MEKTVNLKMPGVMDLDKEELKDIVGGFVWLAVIGAGIYIYNNWDDFEEGFKNGFNSN